ncbi:hypothetical protein LOTGIDRAFT_126879, partial [Lottia gigantea]
FRFSDCYDVLLMVIGVLVSMLHGAAYPAMVYVFGESIDLFISTGVLEQFLNKPSVKEFLGTMLDQMFWYAMYYIIIGSSVIILGYIQISVWMITAERQIHRIRLTFYGNILKQDIRWFDLNDSGQLNSRLSDDIGRIHEGLGDKLGSSVQWISAFLAGCIIGFINGWKLTLVILSISPVLILASALMSKLAASLTNKELKAYAKAGSIAEEVLSSIRTVVAFGGQHTEAVRYGENLTEAKKFGIKKSISNGLCLGFLSFVVMATYSLGFWYGTKLTIIEPEMYSVGKMMIVFYAVFVGSFSLGNASPGFTALSSARGAAYVIYHMIDQKPAINISNDDGLQPEVVNGYIKFRNVSFSYPSRPEVQVLKHIDLNVKKGQTVALVGSSGCGKSTVVQLLQRFYDPLDGQISLDGNNVKELNLNWYRNNIGIVSQEPSLFATTIAENIKFGKEEVTEAQMVEAAKIANAYHFIVQLPQKFNTLVGERGAQLSGGQKQRIAIARALVRDPKILLLDEATSALDSESESIVQKALDKAREGRTTIIIAHRLSTIRSADEIYAFQDGAVMERGNHDELLNKRGIYYNLVMNQVSSVEIEEDLHEFIRTESLRRSGKLERSLSRKSKRSTYTAPPDSDVTQTDTDQSSGGLLTMFAMNSPEWYLIVIGCLAALLSGSVQPSFAIIFSEVLRVGDDSDHLTDIERQNEVLKLCLILLGIGCGSWLATFLQSYMFGISGERLTLRLRKNTFTAMLNQEMAWFDREENNTGSLTTKLATEASSIQGATGVRLGMAFQNISSMGIALVIAFIFGWKLSLLISAFLPFIVIAGAIQIKILAGVAGKNKTALENAGKVAVESLDNIRTVTSFSLQERFQKMYSTQLARPYRRALGKAHLAGAAFGFSQSVIFFAYAASFYYGAYLIRQNEMDYVSVFRVFVAIVFGAYALGQASAFAPDASKAKMAARDICHLLDRKPTIDCNNVTGTIPQQISSAINFRNVRFGYPTRPDINVLKGLDINIEAGQTVALVGTSGCGKSTVIQILQRLYDPYSGNILIGGSKVSDLNIQWLRSQIGLVSQEPVLFNRSIKDNIVYGDLSRTVSTEEVISAARKANIHHFIMQLPKSYDTTVGEKGSQLSGGQKQRIAIARALIRNPKILLLDEATSALDTESEKVVHEALETARVGRTCIIIAHRLSTIQSADNIVVIRNGTVIEQGSHSELLKIQGFYYKLYTAQNKTLLH